MTINEEQYLNIMQALSEARDLAAALGDRGHDITTKIDDAWETLEGEHYPPEIERDDVA